MDVRSSNCPTRRHEAEHQIKESLRAVDTHRRARHRCRPFIAAHKSLPPTSHCHRPVNGIESGFTLVAWIRRRLEDVDEVDDEDERAARESVARAGLTVGE
jgi:hypothetical protein